MPKLKCMYLCRKFLSERCLRRSKESSSITAARIGVHESSHVSPCLTSWSSIENLADIYGRANRFVVGNTRQENDGGLSIHFERDVLKGAVSLNLKNYRIPRLELADSGLQLRN